MLRTTYGKSFRIHGSPFRLIKSKWWMQNSPLCWRRATMSQSIIYWTFLVQQFLQPISMPAQQLYYVTCMLHTSVAAQIQQGITKSGFCVANAMPYHLNYIMCLSSMQTLRNSRTPLSRAVIFCIRSHDSPATVFLWFRWAEEVPEYPTVRRRPSRRTPRRPKTGRGGPR